MMISMPVVSSVTRNHNRDTVVHDVGEIGDVCAGQRTKMNAQGHPKGSMAREGPALQRYAAPEIRLAQQGTARHLVEVSSLLCRTQFTAIRVGGCWKCEGLFAF